MHPQDTSPLTRDEALLALNGHLGREVELSVEVDDGDSTRSVVGAVGILHHWRRERTSG